jgi:hypothetical protein
MIRLRIAHAYSGGRNPEISAARIPVRQSRNAVGPTLETFAGLPGWH